jgi:hypothetical protein
VAAVVATATSADADALDWGVNLITLVLAPIVGEALTTRRSQVFDLEARNRSLRRDQQRVVLMKLGVRDRVQAAIGWIGVVAPLVALFVYCVLLGYPFPIHRYRP